MFIVDENNPSGIIFLSECHFMNSLFLKYGISIEIANNHDEMRWKMNPIFI
jgi:hypothetical protein